MFGVEKHVIVTMSLEISKGYFRSFKSKDRKHDGQKKKVYEQNVHINLDMLQYKQLKYTIV